MALSSGSSFLLASTVALLIFAGMQVFKTHLAGREGLTIVGGFMGSSLFIFLLTAVNNLENALFGRTFQAQLFPEVIGCLLVACFASGLIHRVCVTTCFLFSLVALFYINKISSKIYAIPAPTITVAKSKKKK